VGESTSNSNSNSNSNSTSNSLDQIRRQEMEGLLELGLQPVGGLLLFGPPGCGKTILAREISRILDARPPKIVAAPELLDRWVGGSEKLVRDLFADAEEELRLCNGDPTKSALHVVVIDEIDAVFRKRSSAENSGEATRASAVNQILAKMDGINALGNVLLIGMTNRKELLDPALLRPGRLEVHVEIPPPDQEGRRDILQIHFSALRQRGRLSRPLCEAIDGYADASYKEDRRRSLFPWTKKAESNPYGSRRIRDLAADRWTGGFSGADVAGLVRCAASFALARSRNQGGGAIDSLLITMEDVIRALNEIKK
jgi:vesicle-fusing ATPase